LSLIRCEHDLNLLVRIGGIVVGLWALGKYCGSEGEDASEQGKVLHSLRFRCGDRADCYWDEQ
jgi:hypothetical protein